MRESLAAFEALNGGNARWQQQRDELLPLLTQSLQEDSLLEQLEGAVREVPAAGDKEAHEYFDGHHDKFTEPEQLRLSVILLKVDVGGPQAEWEKARQEAQRIHGQLAKGADFPALARERSGDPSAPKGGDMGYVHRGMLTQELHAKLDDIAVGALSEPLMLLEGYAIFRVEKRLPPEVRSFEQSKTRAAELWQREQAERQWRELRSRLRSAATIEVVDSSRYPSPGTAKE